MIVLTRLDGWDRTLPAAWLRRVAGPTDRRALLRGLAARVLACDPADIEVAHEPGRAPRLVRPAGSGLHLSSTSRDDLAAVAVATDPIGIDVERVEPDREIPWNVLHPDEIAALRARPKGDRARDFARLWTCKEAYLKALGTGLAREPGSVAVRFHDDATAHVRDAEIGRAATAVTSRHACAGRTYSVSLVILAPGSEWPGSERREASSGP